MTSPQTHQLTHPPKKKGFFAQLFNVSFTEFITLKILSVLYVIWMVLIGLAALGATLAVIDQASRWGGNQLFFIPLIWIAALLLLIFGRLSMELVAVIFRIGQNTTILAQSSGGGIPVPPPAFPQPSPPAVAEEVAWGQVQQPGSEASAYEAGQEEYAQEYGVAQQEYAQEYKTAEKQYAQEYGAAQQQYSQDYFDAQEDLKGQ